MTLFHGASSFYSVSRGASNSTKRLMKGNNFSGGNIANPKCARRHSTLFEVLKRAQRRGATEAECISYLLLKRPTHIHKYTIVLIPLQLCSGRKVFALHCRLCCVIMKALNLGNNVSLSPSLSITLSAAQST
jgi:hypothetical protein